MKVHQFDRLVIAFFIIMILSLINAVVYATTGDISDFATKAILFVCGWEMGHIIFKLIFCRTSR